MRRRLGLFMGRWLRLRLVFVCLPGVVFLGRRRPRLQFFYAWVVWLAGWLALWSIATLFWLLGGAEFCALTETVALSLCACIYSGFFLVSAVAQL